MIQAGLYDGMQANWLRWCDRQGALLLTGLELAETERGRADAELERCLVLEARLRELGHSP